MHNTQSLRWLLLSKLSMPVLATVILSAPLSYFVALHYADKVYDSWLLDSAKSLAQEVKSQQHKITFNLPDIAVEVFRWDSMDKTFFKVGSESLGVMGGDKELPSPAASELSQSHPHFANDEFQDQPIRIVSIVTTPMPNEDNDVFDVVVSVAETLNKRHKMMHEILLAVMLPQFFLLLITGLHIGLGINRVLSPLKNLTQFIAQRSPRDLNPIPEAGVPLEVRSLTHTINSLLRQLGDILNSQQYFIENAAHQLRTPLAGLKVQAERALSADSMEAIQPALAQIGNAADRVARLSTQLLVLARSESVT